jgi:soluble lytic murein transglycosylase-like protein
MSTQSIGGSTALVPGEAEVANRIAQIESLLEQTNITVTGGTLAPSSTSSTSTTDSSDFASALQAAGVYDPTGYATSVDTADGSGEGSQYDALIEQAALRNGVEPAVLHGLIEQESGFDPNAQSSAGALGLTQLMPGTASTLGVANPLDPAESIEGGARYLGELMHQFNGNTSDALAAYNAGPAAVDQYGGVPPYAETEDYVSRVLANAEAYRQQQPSTTLSAVAA